MKNRWLFELGLPSTKASLPGYFFNSNEVKESSNDFFRLDSGDI